ncbi:MAG: hypothetical protein MK198_12605 [Gracilimonas sp.]|uniref:hypothetical protein n=1 Tax=Gracilimonas sp. TaxID=1974203 RepID=UPI003752D233|nr:hypothetical protein [Gracilimonas sp.]
MKSVKLLFLLVFVTSLVGCLDTTNGPEVITEPSARSNYYIVNQTESDLNVTYEIAFQNMDSTVAVFADSTTKICEAGDIGSSPPPSSALEKLSFFEMSNNNTSPLLTIQPIVDENWGVSGEEDATRFELVITTEDIK